MTNSINNPLTLVMCAVNPCSKRWLFSFTHELILKNLKFKLLQLGNGKTYQPTLSHSRTLTEQTKTTIDIHLIFKFGLEYQRNIYFKMKIGMSNINFEWIIVIIIIILSKKKFFFFFEPKTHNILTKSFRIHLSLLFGKRRLEYSWRWT